VAECVEAIGSSASQWRVGQRVGVGFFGGYDGHCEFCRREDFINCQKLTVPGIGVDGGYAEMMLADANTRDSGICRELLPKSASCSFDQPIDEGEDHVGSQ
jgi:D-arabinose 1-dehydrogenase-like Zn-dependent alcohol dehydrogenase